MNKELLRRKAYLDSIARGIVPIAEELGTKEIRDQH